MQELNRPYTDAQVLRFLYWDCALSTYEIAERLEASEPTICNWMERHGIERRDSTTATKMRAIRDGSPQVNDSMDSGESDSSGKSRWSFQD